MADELPRIELPEPVVIPPTPGSEWRDAYLLRLELDVDPGGDVEDQSVTVTLRPMCKQTGEVYPASDRDQRITVRGLRTQMAAKPLWAYVCGLICVLADLEVKEAKLRAAIEAASDEEWPVLLDALESLLAGYAVPV